LAVALHPMDVTVLTGGARNIAALGQARDDKDAWTRVRAGVEDFLTDYRDYVRTALGARAAEVRAQVDSCTRRMAETDRLRAELDRLITAESRISEERDQVRRTRDTARADENTLSQAQGQPASATNAARRAHAA